MVIQPVDYYNANARRYAEETMGLDMTQIYQRVLPKVPKGGHILDAGCGSGRDSLYFIKQGYRVSAFDASPGIVKEANRVLPFQVQQMTFENLEYEPKSFDAIWACASLLHLLPKDLPTVILRLQKTLKPDGLLYCSFKNGDGLRIDDFGRRFLDMNERGLQSLLTDCGFANTYFFESVGAGDNWINFMAWLQQ